MTIEIPKAFRFLFEPSRYKVAYGGRGSGKSWAFASALLIKGIQEPLRVVCAREFQNSIDESVHKLLSDLIKQHNMPYNIQQYQITGYNGSEFIFKGLSKQDAAAIKSLEGADICWVEEAQNVSTASWQNLIPTIRKENSEIWATFNPTTEGAPTYNRFVTNTPPNAIVKKVNFDENPFFPNTLEAERLHMLETDPITHRNVWLGEPRTFTEGAFFREQMEWLEKNNKIGDYPHNPAKRVFTFWDLGWADSTAIWFVQAGDGDAFNVIDYWEGSNVSLPDIVKNYIKDKPYNYGLHVLPHDGGNQSRQTGKNDADILRELGLPVHIQQRTKNMERDVHNIRLILPRCNFNKHTTKDGRASLCAYRQEQDNKTGLWRFVHDFSSHGVDAFRYFSVNHDLISSSQSATYKINLPQWKPV